MLIFKRYFSKSISLSLLIWPFFTLLAQEQNEEYFKPEVYCSFWPSFCYEHLRNYPSECSEWTLNGEPNLGFLTKESSEVYFDKELIERISPFIEYLPVNKNENCDFRFCNRCHSPAIRTGYYYDCSDVNCHHYIDCEKYTEEELDNLFDEFRLNVVGYKCNCFKGWWDDVFYSDDAIEDVVEDWQQCRNPSITSAYFDRNNKQYFPFLEQHLRYCSENYDCRCYWPQISKIGCEISNIIYQQMEQLLKKEPFDSLKGKNVVPAGFPYLINCTEYGVFTGLFTHAFFYSQYRTILLDLCVYLDGYDCPAELSNAGIADLYDLIDKIQMPFLSLYSSCLSQHPHPKIYYERGMIYFHRGETFDSFNDIRKCIDLAERSGQDDILTSDLYLQESRVYAEGCLYDKAVEALTQAIRKDPNNKEAYFERAEAYFEKGKFDDALQDYLTSGKSFQKLKLEQDIQLATGLISGILKGLTDGSLDYVPEMLASMGGLGHGLWALLKDPKGVSLELVQGCRNCVQFLQQASWREIGEATIPELRDLLKNWDSSSATSNGEKFGYIVGKYGIEIFASVGVTKGMQAYRNLKRADALCTLEAYKCDASVIAQQSRAYHALRQNSLLTAANLKINPGKQGKHIKVNNNYQAGKSILTHSNPQKLVNDFAGTGMITTKELPGQPGCREIVNCKEIIGKAVKENTTIETETTWGIIYYAKDGTHIVPTMPRE